MPRAKQPGPKKASKPAKKPIEQYRHKGSESTSTRRAAAALLEIRDSDR